MSVQAGAKHSIESSNLADILERVLDKGIVIAGDIKVKLVDVELLTINIRLVICSVDKAKEMGMDWWTGHSFLEGPDQGRGTQAALANRVAELEKKLSALDKKTIEG